MVSYPFFFRLKIITIMYENELGEYIDIFLMMDGFKINN